MDSCIIIWSILAKLYNTIMNAKDAHAFIIDLFQYLLHRAPREHELDNWLALIKGGVTPHAVFRRFVTSREYQKKNATVRTAFPPGHYHSPVVDPATVKEYVAESSSLEVADIEGIGISPEWMLKFWQENLEFIRKTPFPEKQTPQFRFSYEGSPFPYGDAIILRAILRSKRPSRVIEIGSGFSTACILDTADEVGLNNLALTCIEPNPSRLKSLLREPDFRRIELIELPVQRVSIDCFRRLCSGDILFIDSTHVLKTGSDVHYELFSILPSLAPGVLVHFHDCQYPFEYPGKWIFDLNFSWNEVYAVRAFLMYNQQFRITFWNSLFGRLFREQIRADYPKYLKNSGSSLWIEAR